jgi:zinc finger protein
MLRESKCPACARGDFKISTVEIDIPYYGLAYLTTFSCNKCNFKVTDVALAKSNPPTKYIAKIRDVEDLKIKVVKSSTAIIKIPELKVKMEPGSISQGYITNIEGILQRVEDSTIMMKGWLSNLNKIKKCEDVLCKVKEAVEGGFKFTFIIEDPLGNSLLLPENNQKIVKKKFSKAQIKKLIPLTKL